MKMNGMMNMKMEFNINYQIINFFFVPLKIYLFIYLFFLANIKVQIKQPI